MVGITPPLDPAHALRADPQDARSAITIAKLAALMPTGAVSDMVGGASDGAKVSQGRPGGVGIGTAAAPGTPAAQADIRQSLSTAARVILDILDSTQAAPLRSPAPVLPAPPAGGQSAALAGALAQQLGQSGAFYESHLQQWLQGSRTLDTLMREPQAGLGRPAMPAAGPQPATALLPYDPATSARTSAPAAQLSQTAQLAQQAPAAASANAPDAASPEPLVQPPAARPNPPSSPASSAQSTPSAQAHLAQQVAQAYQADLGRPPALSAREALLWGRSTAEEGSRPVAEARQPGAPAAPPASPVHAEAMALVRQQLDILATQQWRWSGEAWPGTPMEWQIVREHDHPGAQRDTDSTAAVWSTRLLLEFPHLGKVEARLTLNGNGLDARLAAPESVNQLHGARAQLQERLGALGLSVNRLTVNGIFWPDGAQPA